MRKTLDTTWMSLAKRLNDLSLALLFFFGAGEEIRPGQRDGLGPLIAINCLYFESVAG